MSRTTLKPPGLKASVKRTKSGLKQNYVSLFLVLLALLCLPGVATAQTTATIGAGAQNGTSSNSATGDPGPMYRSGNTSNFVYSRYHYLYTQAELAAAGILPGVNITKLAWNKDMDAATNSPATFQIWIKNSSKTTVGAGGQNWADLIQGSTQVYNNTALTMALPAQWHEFDFNAPFLYTGGAIEISVNFDISGGTSPWTTAGFSWKKDPITDRTLSYVGSTVPLATLPNLRTVRPQIRITFGAAAPCTAPPTAGVATTSHAVICPNTSFTLNATGNSTGSGQTYQWESSPTGSAPWTPVGTSSNAILFTTTQVTTHFYRLAVTCSGQTTTSQPVQVSTNATPVSGTFTIDKNGTPSATVFTSFASAITSIECGGVNGPIVFNVVAGSGPYNEQVVVPAIPGSSATNTITINGNGNTITTSPTGSNLGIITLDGADFVRFNNLTLTLDASATTGWGVQLMDGADNNTISNSTINLPITSTSSNVNGIVFGATSTTAANNGSNNTFSNNTINGGYYAVRVNGATSGTGTSNNQFLNNTIRDCYIYNFYLSNAPGTVIEGNNISRPTRSTITTFYGVYLTGTNTNVMVSKNRFHNAFGSVASTTSAAYVFYSSSTDATIGSENVFRNNLIYNINTNGTIYAIYNIGSDGSHYFHNTMVLDHATNTGTVRGFFQTTAATNIRFQNNIISMNGGTSGTKHALYFGTTTSTITSNNNVLHVTGSASVGSWGTANQATLADWRTASSQDANSVSADPLFVDPATGNFRPTNVAVNNIGMPIPSVTDDITGATRSTTAPDPGAYEFSVNPNDVGVTAITGAASGCGLTSSQSITITVKNFGSAPQSNIPVNFLVNGTIIGTGTVAGPLAPNDTAAFTFTTPANLGAPGPYAIVANTLMTGDADPSNDTFTLNVTNSLIPSLPVQLDFETTATGIGAVQVVTRTRSNIYENAGASNGPASTKGLIMDGVDNPAWVTPVGVNNPWTTNPEHFSAIYMCINPSGGVPNDSLFLTFDLKQLYKGAAANTNFRVTVNGVQVGSTYNPPFSGPSTNWQRIRVNLSSYKTMSSIQIGLESSVKEGYQNGTGTANLVDNLRVFHTLPGGTRSAALAEQISVYPNPSNGIFRVTAPKAGFTVEVTDVTGRTVLKQNATGAETKLNLKDTATGIYLLKVTSEGTVATKRIVIE